LFPYTFVDTIEDTSAFPKQPQSIYLPLQIEEVYPYTTLSNPQTRPKTCDDHHLEMYLSDADFTIIFGVSKKEFDGLPLWKRNMMKRRCNLHPGDVPKE